MHYLIWMPQSEISPTDTKLQTLERVGLADHVDNAEPMESIGPTGTSGILFCWRKNGPCEFKFDPQEQDWIKAAANGDWKAGRYWVGIQKGNPPIPANLVRAYPYRGENYTLGDGQSWIIPRAESLPRDIILQDDGSLKFETQRMFHAFSMQADAWRTVRDNKEPFKFTAGWHFVVSALRLNYRITPEVASALKLFNTENIGELVAMIIEGQ